MWWRRRRSRLDALAARVEELEYRLGRVAVRQVASETLFSTATAFVAGAIPENLRRRLFHELRNCAHASASDEVIALELEERFDRLLDDIQMMAEVSRLGNVSERQ
ncbi:hypothetical protein CQ14_03015 [Bradyrhizobium lablabi]|uniref:Uncharacterized protein n=1 Tax=Bradyrhizobium lablabi TaxID=722472 RepID=A0A0R3N228_9BRAD|nr:hypothetical protein [Bradyrhizobium lablabi]KRR26472.1 hypothetical protein CQ14_03015 [Bradyrhizobium lablabi]